MKVFLCILLAITIVSYLVDLNTRRAAQREKQHREWQKQFMRRSDEILKEKQRNGIL